MGVRIWIDDDPNRKVPEGYIWVKSVNQAKKLIEELEKKFDAYRNDHLDIDEKDNPYRIELIDIDHDAGDYAHDGGDYYKILDWLEERRRKYPIVRIHSMNTVGIQKMKLIIEANGWREVY